jgi:hypothetical protein
MMARNNPGSAAQIGAQIARRIMGSAFDCASSICHRSPSFCALFSSAFNRFSKSDISCSIVGFASAMVARGPAIASTGAGPHSLLEKLAERFVRRLDQLFIGTRKFAIVGVNLDHGSALPAAIERVAPKPHEMLAGFRRAVRAGHRDRDVVAGVFHGIRRISA